MKTLILSLAQAHMAILAEPNVPDADYAASTARKIEAMLVDCLKAADEATAFYAKTAVLNSGSLKAIKLLPENTKMPNGWGMPNLNVDFILAQNPSYVREALKRGVSLGPSMLLDRFKAFSKNSPSAKMDESLILGSELNGWFVNQIIGFCLKNPTNPAQSALAGKILAAAWKQNSKPFQDEFERICALPSAGVSAEHTYAYALTLALMGAKKPKKSGFENEDVRAFITAITGTELTALKKKIGGLSGWLSHPAETPAALKTIQEKRRFWSSPTSGARRRLY